jgi:hypothetical protein
MPGWLKALLIVVAVIVVLVVGVIIAGVYWWSQNKDALLAGTKAAMEEGRGFGRTSNNQGCVDETISRYRKERGFTAAISSALFETSCLENSRPTPGFCDDVPKQTEFIKSGQWRTDQCSRAGLGGDKYCQQLFAPVQAYCEQGARRSTSNSRTSSY